METNLAVLIDFENIAAGAEKEGLGRFNIQAVMQRFKDKGRVLIARSYADWGRFSRFKQQLLTENVTMYELTSHGMQDKNRADIALVVDALELAFTKDYIDTFVIVSGDSDFTPMVLKMRELNKQVIGCGTRKSTSRLLIQACDEFVFYDSIVKPTSKKRRPKVATTGGAVSTKQAAFALLLDAVEGLQRENPDPPLAGVVKQTMRRKSPDFSESELGFSSFTRFLQAAQEAGLVHVIRDQKAGGVRVDILEGGNDDDDVEAPAAPATWSDSYLPAGSEMWVNALDEVGFHPLAYSTRMDVIEAIVEAVAARKKRRRKTTIQFVAEDVKKALRRTHPDLPLGRIKGVLEALRAADQLVHKDGGPIRTPNATFRLNKDGTALNNALLGIYLAFLRQAGAELIDAPALAELFLGDRERSREVEETLAWMSAPEPVELDLNDKDLDDLLVPDAPAAEAEPEAKPEPEPEAKPKPKPKPKRKSRAKKKEEEPPPAEEPAAEEPAAEAPAEEPAAEAPVEEAPAAEEPAAEEAPKKPRRRRVRKKPEPKPEDEAAPTDLDALLEAE